MCAVCCVPDLLFISPYLHFCGMFSTKSVGHVAQPLEGKKERICTINFGERLHPTLRTRDVAMRCESADFTDPCLLAFTAMALFFFNRNFLLDGENGQNNRAGGLEKWLAPFCHVLVGYREIDGEQRAKGRNMGNPQAITLYNNRDSLQMQALTVKRGCSRLAVGCLHCRDKGAIDALPLSLWFRQNGERVFERVQNMSFYGWQTSLHDSGVFC